jgi:hypothetical protein
LRADCRCNVEGQRQEFSSKNWRKSSIVCTRTPETAWQQRAQA